jgi:aspartate/methionine/tyrosine aminotransferase
MELNSNISGLGESPTLAVNQKAKKMRAAGEDIVHFGFGQSPFPVHISIQEALRKHADKNAYLPGTGLPELGIAITDAYKRNFGVEYSPKRLAIGPGSKELLFQTTLILDSLVLIPAPSWVSYGPQASIANREYKPVPTKRENSYKLTPEDLDRVASTSEKQKLLILNSPSNPTGAVYSDQELKDLADYIKGKNIFVVSDEIYALTTFDGNPAPTISKYLPEQTIVISGISKAESCGGYRLGYIMVHEALEPFFNCLKACISETFSCVSSPVQYAALEAFSPSEELKTYMRKCVEIHTAAGNYLWKRFIDMGLNCPKPEGSFYLFPDFENQKEFLASKGIKTSAELCRAIIDELKVAILPGSAFFCEDDYLGCRVASVDYDGAKVIEAAQNADAINEAFIDEVCPQLKKGADLIENWIT